MKRTFGACVAVAVVAAGCGGAKTAATTVTVTRTSARVAAPREIVLYGHVRSLTRKRGRFVLRFDPAWFLSGTAAERAAVADGVLQPGEPVPNDNYTVDEGHRLLTFDVAADADMTIVTRGPESTRISVGELAQVLAGRNPKHRPLFGTGSARAFGYWARLADTYPNAIVALDQQYHP